MTSQDEAQSKAKKDILEYLGHDECDIDGILLMNLIDDCVTLGRSAKWVVDYYWECEDMRWRIYVSDRAGYEWIDEYVDGARLDLYYADEDY